MKQEFFDYMEEHYEHKTIGNYLRALRHLEKESISLDDRESFRTWILSMRSKGALERTLNAYIKPYNAYLSFLKEARLKPYKNQVSVRRSRARMEDYWKLVEACRGFAHLRDRLMIEILFKGGGSGTRR